MFSKLLHIVFILQLSFFLVLSFQAWGQDYKYIQFTTKDGLPSNYVYGVVEDDEGYIWAYTENGLSKFDGYTFQNYTTKDGLPGNDVTYAEKDGQGIIWLNIHRQGISYLHKDSIKKVSTKDKEDYHFHGCFYDNTLYLDEDNFYLIKSDKSFQKDQKHILPNDLIQLLDSLEKKKYKSKRTIFRSWPNGYFFCTIDGLIVFKNHGLSKILKLEFPLSPKDVFFRQLGNSNLFLLGNHLGQIALIDIDNGIGRRNAAKFRNKGHRSCGLGLLKEKIQTLQNLGIANIEMQMNDLYPQDVQFPGTQVKLVIENYENEAD